MAKQDSNYKDTVLTVPNGTILFLHYYNSDVQRCLEVRTQLDSHPEIRSYCSERPNDNDVLDFLQLVVNFILGEEPVELEMNTYPNIINIQ